MMKRLLWIMYWISALIFSACTSISPITSPPMPPSTTLIANHGITIPLPADWTAIDLDNEDINTRLTALQSRDDSNVWQAAIAQLTAATGHESTILVALYEGQPESDFVPTLMLCCYRAMA